MVQLSLFGIAVCEVPYGKDKTLKAPNTAISRDFCKLIHPRPSIIPNVKYPLSKREERLLDAAWNHAIYLKTRLQ